MYSFQRFSGYDLPRRYLDGERGIIKKNCSFFGKKLTLSLMCYFEMLIDTRSQTSISFGFSTVALHILKKTGKGAITQQNLFSI